MNQRIKVLQLQNSFNVAASDLAEQIVAGLPPERFEVTSAFLRGSPASADQESKAERSLYFRFEKDQTKGLRLKVLWNLYRHCRAERYDAVIVHRFKPINALMILNRLLKIRACIGVLHGLGEYDRAYRRWEMRRLIDRRWQLVGVSRAVRQDLLRCGAGLAPEQVRTINNAIDIDRAERMQLPREQARQRLGLPPQALVLGTIGRLVPVKGHRYLLEAFATLQDRYPDALVSIIGEGRCRAELSDQIRQLGLEGRVILHGAQDDALQYVKAVDVFVMPSLSEGLPLALLEAMSGRLPVIGSNIPSLAPILEDCGGRMFPVRDSKALSSRLCEVLDASADARAAEGERAYQYLRGAHAIEGFRQQYRALLEEMLAGGR